MLKNAVFGPLLSLLLKPQSIYRNFSTRAAGTKSHWLTYNDKIFEPQAPDEPPRPAYVCHSMENIKYPHKKLWYIACFVRGMTVDEALKQLQYVNKKGAIAVRNTILEAQRLAVEDHNVEFKTNLWISESFVGKGTTIKGLRRCARKRITQVRYRYSHYYVTLEEGTPPKDYYYYRKKKSGEELLTEWLEKMRKRGIIGSL